MFFLEALPVPPNRFRPPAVAGGVETQVKKILLFFIILLFKKNGTELF
jgi:hypothetical protein